MPRPLYKHFKCFLSMVSGDHVACTVFRRCYEANIVATVPVLMTPKARDQEAGDPVGGDPLLTTGSPVPSAGLGPCLMCSSPTALGGWLRTSEPKAQQIHSKAERRMAPTLEKAGGVSAAAWSSITPRAGSWHPTGPERAAGGGVSPDRRAGMRVSRT